MIGNAIFVTSALFMALLFYLMQECRFLIPYRTRIWSLYGDTILWFALILFLNVFAVVNLLCRKFLLKDTGRKLAHLEKQVHSGEGFSEELTRRLDE